ncbi:MAG: hypothetical protein ABSG51_12880 [Terracidiphilus sp.]|jgi:hypothetical protein
MCEQRHEGKRILKTCARGPGVGAGLLLGLALVLLVVTKPCAAQTIPGVSRPPLDQPIGQHIGGGLEDLGGPDQLDAERRFRALNAMRQKAMISDTNKLLKLVGELNAEISRESPESLTADQLHKLGTIEKLAHSVKEKMSTPVGPNPSYLPPPAPVMR